MDTLPGVDDPRAGHGRARSTRCSAGRSPRDGLHYVRVVEQTNASPSPAPGLHVVRRGSGATVVALGPVLDEVLAATEGRDVTVLYAHSVRPFDAPTLRSVLASPDVVLVEPWLAGTSARVRGRRAASTYPTGCWRSAPAAPSCAATARPPSTSAPTASTPPGCAAPLDAFLADPGAVSEPPLCAGTVAGTAVCRRA